MNRTKYSKLAPECYKYLRDVKGGYTNERKGKALPVVGDVEKVMV